MQDHPVQPAGEHAAVSAVTAALGRLHARLRTADTALGPLTPPTGSEPALARLAAALETPLHPDLLAFYGSHAGADLLVRLDPDRHWPLDDRSPPLTAMNLTLLQLQDAAAAERLLENQLGHVFQSRQRAAGWFGRARPGADTLFLGFFETTRPAEELMLTIDNTTGYVLAEDPATGPVARLAERLATLLDALVPVPPAD